MLKFIIYPNLPEIYCALVESDFNIPNILLNSGQHLSVLDINVVDIATCKVRTMRVSSHVDSIK